MAGCAESVGAIEDLSSGVAQADFVSNSVSQAAVENPL